MRTQVEANVKRSRHKQQLLAQRTSLLRRILAIMSDGQERTSYEIAALVAPGDWWQVAATIEGNVFETTFSGQYSFNRVKADSRFEARHNGQCWCYRKKSGLFDK